MRIVCNNNAGTDPPLADSSVGLDRGNVTELTKDEAREESLRRWRALPEDERQTTVHAKVFAAALAEQLDFRTMGNNRMVIAAWLIRDLNGDPPWGNIPPESHGQQPADGGD